MESVLMVLKLASGRAGTSGFKARPFYLLVSLK